MNHLELSCTAKQDMFFPPSSYNELLLILGDQHFLATIIGSKDLGTCSQKRIMSIPHFSFIVFSFGFEKAIGPCFHFMYFPIVALFQVVEEDFTVTDPMETYYWMASIT